MTAILLPAAPALADNPYDAEMRDLSQQVSRAGRAARGMVPLLELWRLRDRATPAVVRTELERLGGDRRLPAPRRAYARALLMRALVAAGEWDRAEQIESELGYVTTWRIVGPFDNEGKAGFDTAMPPEEQRLTAADPSATFPGKERPVGWQAYQDHSPYGYVSFDAQLRPNENTCAFAETSVVSERDQALALFTGAGGAIRMWWNGEQVLNDAAYRHPDPDRQVASVAARRGVNRLLVKVCVADTVWGFFLRVTDAAGNPARGIRVDAAEIPEITAGRAAGRSALRLPLAELEAAASGAGARAQAIEDLARFLAWSGADDPAEHRARQLAARAAEMDANIGRLVLAAELGDQRGDVMTFAARAGEIAPDDPESILLRARVVEAGAPAREDALPLLARLPATGRFALEGAVLRAAILTDQSLPRAARRVIETAAAEAPGAPYWIGLRAAAAEEVGRADAAIEQRRALAEARWDDIQNRQMLVRDSVARGETADVLAQLEAIHRIGRADAATLGWIALIHEALGRTDEALATLAEAKQLAPEDVGILVSEAQVLLRLDRRDAAAESLRRALAIRPQDAETRELLETIEPEVRRDEAYAVASRELLGRRVERAAAGYPLTVLQNLSVQTVFPNGLGSQFHQVAVQVHNPEGARRWRTYSIQFDPGAQRVDVRLARVYRGGQTLESLQMFEQQLGEPWYRIYYDTRALVVVFPDLEPGDVVELRYRLDDTSHRNMFADYYGDLHFLQGFEPIVRSDYVLITPSSRQFYFNEPGLRSLQHESRTEGQNRIDHFHAENVAPAREEDGMPGMTEVVPYLHVSTYRTWEDVGRWWWGLVRDQLYADDPLRETVREITRGARTEREKVQRIQSWVVRNTRYVGLEFGIHGFQPYRVPQIVRRGFGDCKDKASLLYTMMREAGIEAHLVLVRTRRNGNITDLPASLAVFDHAIAYVPSLDLYIDGTAEHSGMTELPDMDQGVTVLHVWADGAELRRTPVLPPDRNRRSREMDVRLAADGSAEIRVEEAVSGSQAPGYRSTYQAAGTRGERFERALRGLFPGLTLESQEFSNLEDLEQPVTYNYRARVPQLAQRDGDVLHVAPTTLGDLQRMMARTGTRQHVLDLGATSSYVEERTVRVPPGGRVVHAPDGGSAESEFGSLRVAIESDGRQVQARTEFELRRDRVTPAEYPAFRRWVEQADAILRQRIDIGGGGAQ